MYEEYFSFAASPFRLNPDPKFFFGSKSHNKAMAYLHYGLRQAEGFIVITGEIGAGKSLLIGHLLDQLDRSNVVAAHLLTTNLEPSALLSHILSAFRIEPSGSGKSAEIEAFEDFLFDQMNRGRRVLLIVDEAQNLPVPTIEELRMLSNMDYDGTPLFQIFLVGQPEFRSVLSNAEMEQFRQRIIASYHLEPLGCEETTNYIRHRLALVGWEDNPAISDDAFEAIFGATGGVPRKINKLCNRILLHCSIEKLNSIDREVVNAVVTDLDAENLQRGASGDAADSAKDGAGLAANPLPGKKIKKAATQRSDRAGLRAKSEAEAPIETPKRAVGDHGGRHDRAGASQSARDPVVIPFQSARKVASSTPKPAPVLVGEESPVRKAPPEQAERADSSPSLSQDAPRAEERDGSMSVLDRLRAQRNDATKPHPLSGPAPATLNDVAQAIAAASAARGENGEFLSIDADDEEASTTISAQSINEPPLAEDPSGWRHSIEKAIDETRDELKVAHSSVARLGRQLAEIGKRRRDRRAHIAANIARAEAMLSELRDAAK